MCVDHFDIPLLAAITQSIVITFTCSSLSSPKEIPPDMRTVAVSGTLNTFHPERNHLAEENGIRETPTKAFKEGGELGLSSSFTPTGAPS